MFKFLKDKIKKGIESFSKKVDEEGETIEHEGSEKEFFEESSKAKDDQATDKDTQESEVAEPEKSDTFEETDMPNDTSTEEKIVKDDATDKSERATDEESKKTEELKSVEPEEELIEDKSEHLEEIEDKIPDEELIEDKYPHLEQIEDSKVEEELLEDKSIHLEEIKDKRSEGDLFEDKSPNVAVIEESKEEAVESKIQKEPDDQVEIPEEKPEGTQVPDQDITDTEEKSKKEGFFSRFKKTFQKEEKKIEEEIEKLEDVKEPSQNGQTETEEKKGFFDKVAQSVITKRINKEKFDDLFWDLELMLLENNVAVEVIEKIKVDLAVELVDKPLPRAGIQKTIEDTLQRSISELYKIIDFWAEVERKKPFVICMIGINGSGKTTSIAKLTKAMQNKGKSVVLAAGDTFRAAAIDQLTFHADKLGVKIIKHDYGNDAAAVAFDAVKHAEAKGKDVVIIDTAGRLHSNSNLLDELKKIVRVAKPDMKIFVGESITGNDCIEQAKEFDLAVGIDGIILTKADIDERGGASISVSYVTGKPILFMGMGQEYEDLEEFDKEKIVGNLFS